MYTAFVILPFTDEDYDKMMENLGAGRRASPFHYREAYLEAQTEERQEFIDSKPWSGTMLSTGHVKIEFNSLLDEEEKKEFLRLFAGCPGRIGGIDIPTPI